MTHTARRSCPIERIDYRYPGSRLLLGPGVIDHLGAEVQALGCERVMVTAGRNTSKTRLFAHVLASLGSRTRVVFDEVVQHGSTASVAHGADLARDAGIDGLVAVGGGSASDTAKAIAIVLAEGGRIEDHASRFEPPDRLLQKELRQPKLPIVAVPTTAAGADVTPGLAIRTSDGQKLLYWDWHLPARLSVVDPVANLEVPAGLMATTSMNGLAHCIEGLYSKVRDPISSSLARESIRRFGRALPAMTEHPDDPGIRSEILLAAHLAGVVIANARTGIQHAICHCLGALAGVAHGVAHAVMLPHSMRHNLDVACDALADVADALDPATAHAPAQQGAREAQARRAVELVGQLQARLDVPVRLRDIGVERAMLQEIARHVLTDRSLYFNPRPTASAPVITALLEQAW